MRIPRTTAGRVAGALGVLATLALVAGCASTQATTASVPGVRATASVPTQRPAAKPDVTPRPAPVPSAAAPAPTASPAAAACAATTPGTKHVYVSISKQHLWACTGPLLTVESAVTTGASALTNVHDATPTGTYAITSKTMHVTLAGSDVNGSWNDPVTYWMPFAGGDGFHDAPWQTFPLGSPLYTAQGSHGCVHVALAPLATLYAWAPVGTPVTVTA